MAGMAERTCSIDDCDKPHYGRGYCQNHYSRWRRTGEPRPDRPFRKRGGQRCAVEGCTEPYRAGGYCKTHYSRWLRWGDPLVVHPYAPTGPSHYRWKGPAVGYIAVHDRLRQARGSASEYSCVTCGRQAREWAYDHADPNEVPRGEYPAYSYDMARYRAMCSSCHVRFDRNKKVGQ